jgi:hypothetical protein
MNFLDYLVNAMTAGQPSAQELEMRKMAQQGLLGNPSSVIRESEMPKYSTGNVLRESEMYNDPGRNVLRESEIRMTPEMIRNMTPPISGKGPMADQYRQNLFNPSRTMQQNYIDPRLIELMYYKGLLNQ